MSRNDEPLYTSTRRDALQGMPVPLNGSAKHVQIQEDSESSRAGSVSIRDASASNAARALRAPQPLRKGRWLQRTVTPGLGRARGFGARIRRFSPVGRYTGFRDGSQLCLLELVLCNHGIVGLLNLRNSAEDESSGIPSNLLFLMPWRSTHAAFRGLGAAFLVFDMVLFALFSSMFITRYIVRSSCSFRTKMSIRVDSYIRKSFRQR
jgi:hypothetical protein